MNLLTYTLRARPNERQDSHRVKHTVDVNPEHIVSLHDPVDIDGGRCSYGCDILLITGLILPVEDGRVEIRGHLGSLK